MLSYQNLKYSSLFIMSSMPRMLRMLLSTYRRFFPLTVSSSSVHSPSFTDCNIFSSFSIPVIRAIISLFTSIIPSRISIFEIKGRILARKVLSFGRYFGLSTPINPNKWPSFNNGRSISLRISWCTNIFHKSGADSRYISTSLIITGLSSFRLPITSFTRSPGTDAR